VPEDFGFYYPHAIKEIIQTAYILEHFHTWPEPGGYFDQDAKWIADMLTWQSVKAWRKDEKVKAEQDG
jgi:hypothetical protein